MSTKDPGRAWRLTSWLLFRNLTARWRWPEGGEPKEDWLAIRFEGSGDGTLAGLWGAAHTPARGTVVLAHPTSKKAKGYFLDLGHGRFLRDAGYNVLLFDFNGFGESPSCGFRYPRDVLAAGREAQRRAPGRPVGLLGVCFGASYGICALARPDHPFTAAIFEAPFPNEDAILEAIVRRSSKRSPLLVAGRLLLKGLRAFFPDVDLRAENCAPHLRGLKSVLFVSGEHDDYVPTATVARLADACGKPGPRGVEHCEVWEVPGAEHLKHLPPDPPRYANRVISFFDTAFGETAREEAAATQRAREPVA